MIHLCDKIPNADSYFVSDESTYKRQEIIEKLAIHFELAQVERAERTPSGANRFTTAVVMSGSEAVVIS